MGLSDDLLAVKDQLTKAKGEIVSKISDLEGALATAGAQPQDVTDAVAALKDVAQSLDDVVADAAPVEAELVAEAVVAVDEAATDEPPIS